MKDFKTFVILISVACFSFMAVSKKRVADGFAVVELFTSEGCSSCPPADELVARIQKENSDQPVYILSFHVDYWNNLGWKDPFSSAAYSKRQKEYANRLNLQSIYTPQVIVNGRTEFVGSDEGKMLNAIKSNLQKNSASLMTLKILQKEGHVLLELQPVQAAIDTIDVWLTEATQLNNIMAKN